MRLLMSFPCTHVHKAWRNWGTLAWWVGWLGVGGARGKKDTASFLCSPANQEWGAESGSSDRSLPRQGDVSNGKKSLPEGELPCELSLWGAQSSQNGQQWPETSKTDGWERNRHQFSKSYNKESKPGSRRQNHQKEIGLVGTVGSLCPIWRAALLRTSQFLPPGNVGSGLPPFPFLGSVFYLCS